MTEAGIDALSAPRNANGRDRVAMASSAAMTPPCTTTATRWSGCAAAIRVMAPLVRAFNTSAGSAPGITSHRSSAHIRSAIG